jgi:hypothetical protein
VFIVDTTAGHTMNAHLARRRPSCVLALLAPHAPPRPVLARMIVTQRAYFIIIAVIQQHMAGWTEVFVGSNAGPTNVEKAHSISPYYLAFALLGLANIVFAEGS